MQFKKCPYRKIGKNNLVLLVLKGKSEWNLNKVSNEFSISIAGSTSIHEKNDHKVFLSKSMKGQ